MQLMDGICSVLGAVNTAAPGAAPVFGWPVLFSAWFAELEFVSVPAFQTELQETDRVDRRIRILWCDSMALAKAVSIDGVRYKIVRVFSGMDADAGARIADISLQRWETSDEEEGGIDAD